MCTPLDGKPQLLGKLKSGELVFQSIKTHDLAARVHGTAAVITGMAELHVVNARQRRVLSLRYTATSGQHDGHWQLVAHHSGQLPG